MYRAELMSMMPATADDLPAAKRVVELGYPAVAPVMRDMVRWMRVAESPVADAFADFFASVGAPAAGVIAEGLRRDNCWLKHRILTVVLPAWPADAVQQLSCDLSIAATHPDAYDNDLHCVAILARHGLVDLKWLRGWVTFKKERWAVRNALLTEVEEQLRKAQSDGGNKSDENP